MDTNKWNAHLYDAKHRFVSDYGNDVIKLLAPKQHEKILDLGCGTGDLANELYRRGVNVVGIDHSSTMVEQAKQKYPHIPFYVEDITNLPYVEEFDAIFSNAVLHWVKYPKSALDNMYKSLRVGGRLVAEFGGEGNVHELTNTLIQQVREAGYTFTDSNFPWYFPSIAEYTTFMEQVGFQVTYAYLYDRPTLLKDADGLRNWINMFAEDFMYDVPVMEREKIIERIEQALKGVLYQDDGWIADYVRLQVKGVK